MKRSALPLVRGVLGAGAVVLEAEGAAGMGEDVRAIADAVVGEHSFEADAQALVVRQCGLQEVEHGGASFIGVDGGEGDAAVIVDGDMDALRTDARHLVAAVAGDPVAWPGDARQALDVEMQQVARCGMLVALDAFRKYQGVRLLIANPAAAREGLTLTEASTAIYLDAPSIL